MSLFDRLDEDGDDTPPIIVLYGVDGIGKTTLATEAPDAVYLHTRGENLPSGMKTPKAPIKDYLDLKDSLIDLVEDDHDFRWVILDALDGIEPLVWEEVCYENNKENMEAFGFGKGYLAADEYWGEILDLLIELKEMSIGVIILAHPSIELFQSPISEPYNRYTIKIHKRANALIREASDIVAFMNHRVKIKETEVSRGKKVSHAEGKSRMIYLSGEAAWDAKNRYSMPDSLEYKKGKGFESLQAYFPEPKGKKRRK